VGLRARGVEADFACAPDAGASINKVVETARDRGLEPILSLRLYKHRHPLYSWLDRRALARLLDVCPYDLIHCHLDNDHAIALAPAARRGIPIVRSSYEGLGFKRDRLHAKLLQNAVMLIEPSQRALDHDAEAFALPQDRLCVVPGAIDVNRFDPRRETPDMRQWLRIPRDAFVVGIIARMQTHRHYEDLFHAFKILLETAPEAHLVVVGRGTNQQKVGVDPVRALGLTERVHFPGFIDGENYVGMLRAFDVGVFLVPGSDGTCRATREILAMGKPLIAADRGMLAEIVTHGQDGLVFDGSVEGLAAALQRTHANRAERLQMAHVAREHAVAVYSIEAQSATVAEIYTQLLTKCRD
jgi:glycosyltransferase involved in cell wall biosynthesis